MMIDVAERWRLIVDEALQRIEAGELYSRFQSLVGMEQFEVIRLKSHHILIFSGLRQTNSAEASVKPWDGMIWPDCESGKIWSASIFSQSPTSSAIEDFHSGWILDDAEDVLLAAQKAFGDSLQGSVG